MNYIYDLHKTLHNNKIILAYEGEFTQQITKQVLNMAERNLESQNEELGIRRKVFNVMIGSVPSIKLPHYRSRTFCSVEKQFTWFEASINRDFIEFLNLGHVNVPFFNEMYWP